MRVARTIIDNISTMLRQWLESMAVALDGHICFGDTMSNTDTTTNMECWKFTGTSPGAANTDFTLSHSLTDSNGHPRVPLTIVGQDTKDGSVLYRSPATPWTKTTITLRSTGASSVYNVIVS
jgi:hypothetical protein